MTSRYNPEHAGDEGVVRGSLVKYLSMVAGVKVYAVSSTVTVHATSPFDTAADAETELTVCPFL